MLITALTLKLTKTNKVENENETIVKNDFVTLQEETYNTVEIKRTVNKNITTAVIKLDNTATVKITGKRLYSDAADEGSEEYNKRQELINNIYEKEREIMINGNKKIEDVVLLDNVSNTESDAYGIVRDTNNKYYLVDFINKQDLGKSVRVIEEISQIEGKDLKVVNKKENATSYNEYVFTLNSGDSITLSLNFF